MTPQDRLIAIGQALYGKQWQGPLSEALNVQTRTVRYWLQNGKIKPAIWEELEALCLKRMPELIEAVQVAKGATK